MKESEEALIIKELLKTFEENDRDRKIKELGQINDVINVMMRPQVQDIIDSQNKLG